MRYFAITSDHPRHVKFLETLYSKIDLDLVIIVSKTTDAPDIIEKKYFKANEFVLSRPNVLRCDESQLGSRFVLNTIKNLSPDVGFVFGAPILKEELFKIPSYGCVNIHTGLVDHYRGVDSTLWALNDERLDLIGSTLHYIDENIDTGEIIAQRKIWNHDLDDTPDTLVYKACKVGFDLLEDKLYNIINNNVRIANLESSGKLYQSKDMNPSVMKNIETKTPRLLKEYLSGNNS